MKALECIRGFSHLKGVLGTNEQKAKYYDQIWQKEIQRGNLSPEQAALLSREILDGTYRLFFADAAVGFFTHWALEKAVLPVVGNFFVSNLPSEIAYTATGYFAASNLLAIPYFIPRAAIEYNHLKKTEGKTTRLDNASLAASVLLNAALPPFTIFSTPALNFPRFKLFSKTLIRHYYQNLADSAKNARNSYRNVFF